MIRVELACRKRNHEKDCNIGKNITYLLYIFYNNFFDAFKTILFKKNNFNISIPSLNYEPNEITIIINVSIISKIKKHLCKHVAMVSIQSVIFDQYTYISIYV